MRKILILSLIMLNSLFAQIGYVETENTVYNFLDRMNSLHIIENYNSFEIPKTRKEIIKYLSEILTVKNELNNIDLKTLEDYLIEFEFDLYYSTNNYSSLFGDTVSITSQLLDQKEKFLYYYTDSSNFNTFVNFIGSSEYIVPIGRFPEKFGNTSLFTFGGEIRGTIGNNYGYYARATNGLQFGDTDLASANSNLKYNYKFNSDHDSSKFFDETIGYLSAEFDYIKFKIGRDRVNIGYGYSKIIMDNYFPPMDYISMHLNYSIFDFSFLHGKLLGFGAYGSKNNSSGRVINDKYIAYHRLGLNFSKHFQLGLGETIIYANRNLDFSYLNPFNFYKSAEHANQDRDNSMMFIDFRNNSLKGLSLYTTILIDDVDFSKLGTNWYGNKFIYDFGFTYEPFPKSFPLTIGFQYLRIDPYVYAHRLEENNYTSMDFGIGPNIQPNSESYYFDVKYKPHHRVDLNISYQYVVHGANETDKDGNVLINYGGDILVGHRIWDSEDVVFLDGLTERTQNIRFTVLYEPINNYLFSLLVNLVNIDISNYLMFGTPYTKLKFSIRI